MAEYDQHERMRGQRLPATASPALGNEPRATEAAPPGPVGGAALANPRLGHPTASPLRRAALQRVAGSRGNHAAAAAIARARVAEPGPAEEQQEQQAEADPIVNATLTFGPYVPSGQWSMGAPARAFASRSDRSSDTGANLFASRAQRATPAIQRADAEAGGVSFTVTAFSPTVAGGLQITEDATGVGISSQTYTATGTVEATGPKSRVANWDVGFLQTVYESSRNFYYKSSARTKSSDVCTVLPVRDGDTLIQPWYGMETVSSFLAASPDTQSSTMQDTPGTSSSWDDPVSGEADTLDHTDGRDVFRSWLAVRNRTDFHKKYLRFADWRVDYSTTVDTTQPVGSRVTAGGAAGASVTGQGNGMGGKQPALFDPVANDVAKVRNTTW